MRYKVVPEPLPDADALGDAQRAVPLVPGSVEDCCTRLRDRLGLASRDEARELLTFLEALGLATETDRGYRRTDRDPEALADPFRNRVFGARELLAAVDAADGPLTAGAAFERLRGDVPTWERHRHEHWDAEWRTRVERLLEWARLLGLVVVDEEGYRPATG